jgi:hypothetical protein
MCSRAVKTKEINMQNEIMSETEVAEMCCVNLRTMQRQRAEGKLPFPFVKIGDRVLYHRQAVLNSFFKPGESTMPVYEPAEKPKATVKRGRGRPRKNS